MKLLVFGASGGTGRHLVSQALARGFDVTAFVRKAGSLAPQPGLEIIEGDVGDMTAVTRAIAPHSIVISALGVSTASKADAWRTVVRAGINHIVSAMEGGMPRRLLYLSFIGVSGSRHAAGPLLRYVARFPLRHEIADHELKEQRIAASPIQWTIVRAPKLTDDARTGAYRAGESITATSFLPQLSRADVAEFLIGEAETPRYPRKVVRLLPATAAA